MTNQNKKPITTYILWAVFLSLLLVLLPHTAWAFRKFEPSQSFIIYGTFTISDLLSYVAAFAFEAAIAVLVHKLAEHLEKKLPKSISKSDKLAVFTFRYINPISFALVIVTVVSALANLAHAVEYGQVLKIFDTWGIPFAVYTLAFGAILPLLSLTFARVLSNVAEDEDATSPEMVEANKTIGELRKTLRETELRRVSAEDRARTAEDRFGALGDLVKLLFADEKQKRIVAAYKLWGKLPQSAIAIIADASPSFVNETLSKQELIEG